MRVSWELDGWAELLEDLEGLAGVVREASERARVVAGRRRWLVLEAVCDMLEKSLSLVERARQLVRRLMEEEEDGEVR
ncbi:MAG: hypothetical protein ACTSWP_10815 [Candidatus Freyarchaeota archaeon]